jgi:hypothetical protein
MQNKTIKMNAITVIIYNARNDNRPAKRVNVYGYYNCGIMGDCPTSKEQTDNDGRCVLTWDSDMRKLNTILVAGEKHKGDFRPGNTYTFTTTRA